jgi:hypothetical protein
VKSTIRDIFEQPGLRSLLEMQDYKKMWDDNNEKFEKLFRFLDSSPREIIDSSEWKYDVFTSRTNYECLSRIEFIGKSSTCDKTMLLSLCSTLEYYRLNRKAFCNEGNFDVVSHDIKKNAARAESCVRILNEHIAMAFYVTKKIEEKDLKSMLSDPSVLCEINITKVYELFKLGSDREDILHFVRFVCNHFAESKDDIDAFDNYTKWYLDGKKGKNPAEDFVERIDEDISILFGVNYVDVVKGCGLPEPLQLCLKHILSLNFDRVQELYRRKCVKVFDLSDTEYIMGKNEKVGSLKIPEKAARNIVI